MITLNNVTFGYKKREPIFKNMNLELEGGHIYGLLGKNGVGKTTLLKIICGLRFAQEGVINILDTPAQWRQASILQNIYYLGEEIAAPNLSIHHFLRAYAPFYPNFNYEQMDTYLEQFEITNMRQKISSMSHGEKKKVFIAFALATNVKILLMDEPTNGLDIPSKSMFRKVMSMAADNERLFLISTHQVRDLHSLIDAIVLLDKGEIIVAESTDNITEKLLFKIVDDLNEAPNAIYTEDTIRGIYTVSPNIYHEENKLDIELFFNAVLHNKKKIKEIFHQF